MLHMRDELSVIVPVEPLAMPNIIALSPSGTPRHKVTSSGAPAAITKGTATMTGPTDHRHQPYHQSSHQQEQQKHHKELVTTTTTRSSLFNNRSNKNLDNNKVKSSSSSSKFDLKNTLMKFNNDEQQISPTPPKGGRQIPGGTTTHLQEFAHAMTRTRGKSILKQPGSPKGGPGGERGDDPPSFSSSPKSVSIVTDSSMGPVSPPRLRGLNTQRGRGSLHGTPTSAPKHQRTSSSSNPSSSPQPLMLSTLSWSASASSFQQQQQQRPTKATATTHKTPSSAYKQHEDNGSFSWGGTATAIDLDIDNGSMGEESKPAAHVPSMTSFMTQSGGGDSEQQQQNTSGMVSCFSLSTTTNGGGGGHHRSFSPSNKALMRRPSMTTATFSASSPTRTRKQSVTASKTSTSTISASALSKQHNSSASSFPRSTTNKASSPSPARGGAGGRRLSTSTSTTTTTSSNNKAGGTPLNKNRLGNISSANNSNKKSTVKSQVLLSEIGNFDNASPMPSFGDGATTTDDSGADSTNGGTRRPSDRAAADNINLKHELSGTMQSQSASPAATSPKVPQLDFSLLQSPNHLSRNVQLAQQKVKTEEEEADTQFMFSQMSPIKPLNGHSLQQLQQKLSQEQQQAAEHQQQQQQQRPVLFATGASGSTLLGSSQSNNNSTNTNTTTKTIAPSTTAAAAGTNIIGVGVTNNNHHSVGSTSVAPPASYSNSNNKTRSGSLADQSVYLASLEVLSDTSSMIKKQKKTTTCGLSMGHGHGGRNKPAADEEAQSAHVTLRPRGGEILSSSSSSSSSSSQAQGGGNTTALITTSAPSTPGDAMNTYHRRPDQPLAVKICDAGDKRAMREEVVFTVRCGAAFMTTAPLPPALPANNPNSSNGSTGGGKDQQQQQQHQQKDEKKDDVNPTMFQCGTRFLSVGDDVDAPVTMSWLPKKDRGRARGQSVIAPAGHNPLTTHLDMQDGYDKFADTVDSTCVLSRVWDVRYEGKGTVGLRSAAYPNYWLARDPVNNTLRLVPAEQRTDYSRFKLLCH